VNSRSSSAVPLRGTGFVRKIARASSRARFLLAEKKPPVDVTAIMSARGAGRDGLIQVEKNTADAIVWAMTSSVRFCSHYRARATSLITFAQPSKEPALDSNPISRARGIYQQPRS